MPSRTRIVCLHEGERGRSIDPVFINTLIKSLDPLWLRPWEGSNMVRLVPCGGRTALIGRFPTELKNCLEVGSDTTLMVWADLDHDIADGDSLKLLLRRSAVTAGIPTTDFERVVFAFPKDRLENWIQFLDTGGTNEAIEGPRVAYPRYAAEAAKVLADRCQGRTHGSPLPPSLQWSCDNWRRHVRRMKSS
jgi:hypothetical protein